jgi:hypothetical protein
MKINKNKKIWQQITSKKWCQGQMFTSKTGEPCEVEDSVRACSFGWLNLVYPRASDYNRARTKLKKVIPNGFIVNWNDNPYTAFKEVKAAFKKANI